MSWESTGRFASLPAQQRGIVARRANIFENQQTTTVSRLDEIFEECMGDISEEQSETMMGIVRSIFCSQAPPQDIDNAFQRAGVKGSRLAGGFEILGAPPTVNLWDCTNQMSSLTTTQPLGVNCNISNYGAKQNVNDVSYNEPGVLINVNCVWDGYNSVANYAEIGTRQLIPLDGYAPPAQPGAPSQGPTLAQTVPLGPALHDLTWMGPYGVPALVMPPSVGTSVFGDKNKCSASNVPSVAYGSTGPYVPDAGYTVSAEVPLYNLGASYPNGYNWGPYSSSGLPNPDMPTYWNGQQNGYLWNPGYLQPTVQNSSQAGLFDAVMVLLESDLQPKKSVLLENNFNLGRVLAMQASMSITANSVNIASNGIGSCAMVPDIVQPTFTPSNLMAQGGKNGISQVKMVSTTDMNGATQGGIKYILGTNVRRTMAPLNYNIVAGVGDAGYKRRLFTTTLPANGVANYMLPISGSDTFSAVSSILPSGPTGPNLTNPAVNGAAAGSGSWSPAPAIVSFVDADKQYANHYFSNLITDRIGGAFREVLWISDRFKNVGGTFSQIQKSSDSNVQLGNFTSGFQSHVPFSGSCISKKDITNINVALIPSTTLRPIYTFNWTIGPAATRACSLGYGCHVFIQVTAGGNVNQQQIPFALGQWAGTAGVAASGMTQPRPSDLGSFSNLATASSGWANATSATGPSGQSVGFSGLTTDFNALIGGVGSDVLAGGLMSTFTTVVEVPVNPFAEDVTAPACWTYAGTFIFLSSMTDANMQVTMDCEIPRYYDTGVISPAFVSRLDGITPGQQVNMQWQSTWELIANSAARAISKNPRVERPLLSSEAFARFLELLFEHSDAPFFRTVMTDQQWDNAAIKVMEYTNIKDFFRDVVIRQPALTSLKVQGAMQEVGALVTRNNRSGSGFVSDAITGSQLADTIHALESSLDSKYGEQLEHMQEINRERADQIRQLKQSLREMQDKLGAVQDVQESQMASAPSESGYDQAIKTAGKFARAREVDSDEDERPMKKSAGAYGTFFDNENRVHLRPGNPNSFGGITVSGSPFFSQESYEYGVGLATHPTRTSIRDGVVLKDAIEMALKAVKGSSCRWMNFDETMSTFIQIASASYIQLEELDGKNLPVRKTAVNSKLNPNDPHLRAVVKRPTPKQTKYMTDIFTKAANAAARGNEKVVQAVQEWTAKNEKALSEDDPRTRKAVHAVGTRTGMNRTSYATDKDGDLRVGVRKAFATSFSPEDYGAIFVSKNYTADEVVQWKLFDVNGNPYRDEIETVGWLTASMFSEMKRAWSNKEEYTQTKAVQRIMKQLQAAVSNNFDRLLVVAASLERVMNGEDVMKALMEDYPIQVAYVFPTFEDGHVQNFAKSRRDSANSLTHSSVVKLDTPAHVSPAEPRLHYESVAKVKGILPTNSMSKPGLKKKVV